jgi:hypothetical protein
MLANTSTNARTNTGTNTSTSTNSTCTIGFVPYFANNYILTIAKGTMPMAHGCLANAYILKRCGFVPNSGRDHRAEEKTNVMYLVLVLNCT